MSRTMGRKTMYTLIYYYLKYNIIYFYIKHLKDCIKNINLWPIKPITKKTRLHNDEPSEN